MSLAENQALARSEAEADGLLRAGLFAYPLTVVAGRGVVILAAGVYQQPGETRLQWLGRHAALFCESN